ncbi:MAG: Phosphoenolpyruvate-protein phosphotransferase [Planctomycetes bacterium]|nr:Phosphoenolpyruvate-protein phosphotransferase [Planctomycetota bacterium]
MGDPDGGRMEVHPGIAVSPGYAIGPVAVLREDGVRVPHRTVPAKAVPAELAKVEKAFEAALEEMNELARSAGAGTEVQSILSTHQMLLEDPALRASIEQRLREGKLGAETAVAEALDAISLRFENLPDPYFQQRAADVRDVRRRLLRPLTGVRGGSKSGGDPAVIAVRELSPSATASLDRAATLGFLTDVGGPTSHTAIIARSLGIPAVVGLGDVVSRIEEGAIVVVDGNRGEVVLNPDESSLARYRALAEKHAAWMKLLSKLRELPAETRDGHSIRLMGNIERPDEVDGVLRAGGDGIGLFRTEFLWVPGKPPPDEDEHFRAYVGAAKKLGGKPLTIRTFDFGADKATPDPGAEREPNPALGLRSIRWCLERPQVFLPQIRAILRAATHGSVRCLFPMISGVGELRRAREFVDRARVQLRAEGVAVPDHVPVGVMVEIPSAAVLCDLLVDEVDFLSIGSNDLIQYALAVDRVNARVASLYEPAHPALLRLIRNVVTVAGERNVPVSLCGEMAGDRLYTVLLVGMGFRDLSISARAIPEIKQAIRSITVEQARHAADWCAGARSAEETRGRIREAMAELLRD